VVIEEGWPFALRRPKRVKEAHTMKTDIVQIREGLRRFYRAPYLFKAVPRAVRSVLDALSLRKDDIIVDFGAGDGTFTMPIARELEKQRGSGVVFGCDFSPTLVYRLDAAAAEEGLDAHIRAVCLNNIAPHILPFSSDRADKIVAANVIQYLEDPLPYLTEIARVLKPYGVAMIVDWQRLGDRSKRPGVRRSSLISHLEAVGLITKGAIALDGCTFAVRAMKPVRVNV
jgi:SAM-dependent methyltransferase